MSGEIAVPERRQIVVATPRAKVMLDALTEEAEQREVLKQYVQHHMVSGTDYGVIPGTKNKSLLKPGAEKLTDLFRSTPQYTQTRVIEDWDKPLFHYEFRCEIVSRDAGTVLAVGVGSANSREAKWRWRNGDRKCPGCGAAAIKRSKYPPRDRPQDQPGWYCYGKAGGCGANFDAADPAVVGQPTGRVENPDVFDCVNSILKIAKKRALVDAAIALARCSDLFTQDVEDHDDHGSESPAGGPPNNRPQQQKPAGRTQQPAARPSPLAELHADMAAAPPVADGEDLKERFAALADRLRKHPRFDPSVLDQFVTDATDSDTWTWEIVTPDQGEKAWRMAVAFVAAEAKKQGGAS